MSNAIRGVCLTLLILTALIACSIFTGKPPTRAQVEAGEDKFCAAVAKIRRAESLAQTLNSSKAQATAPSGSLGGE